MNVRQIVTEDACAEQWRMLGRFFYEPNIRRFLENGNQSVHSDLTHYIAGSLRQGQAYFESAERAPLDISPLLLYYGLSNLLAGATALLSGSHTDILAVSNHGMTLPKAQLSVKDNGEPEARYDAPAIIAEDEKPSGQEAEVTTQEDADIRVLPRSIAQIEVVLNNFKDSAFFLFSRQFCPSVVFPP